PVERGPGPAAARHPGRLEVGAPGVGRAEVAADEVAERAIRIATSSTEMAEVELVILDPSDRKAEIDLQRAELRVDLVRRAEVYIGEPAEDLVPLPDVPLVELVVGLDRSARDPVQLQHLRP